MKVLATYSFPPLNVTPMTRHICTVLFASFLACSFSLNAWAAEPAEPSREDVEFFETKIRPLLHAHCVECHSDSDPESGLSLESYEGLHRGGKLGAAVTPGKPKESLLISAVNHDEFLKMPPKSKLSTAELAALSQWVTMGAPWPNGRPTTNLPKALDQDKVDEPKFTEQQKSFWAYQPVSRPPLPTSALQSSGFQSPIDCFIADQIDRANIQPNGHAGKRELLRRVTYDLTGLTPDAEEFARFEADHAPDAFERVVDRLLSSPRYGEKWGRHWLDVARYADSNGLDENIGYPQAFRYRDYVIDSFNSDKAYDRFVQEQIAGDLVAADPRSLDRSPFDHQVATGFLAIGAKMLAEDDPMKMQMDIIDEQLSVLCQAFMGMTIGCARCHDHKYDPLTAADYYALAGIFKSSQTMEHHKVVAHLFERPLATPEIIQQAKEIDDRLSAAKAELTKLNESVEARVKDEVRRLVSQALRATVEYDQFATDSTNQSRSGVNHTDPGGLGYQADQSEKPYQVTDGYALFEAEGYHRGTVGRDKDEYGKEIGIVGSSGAANVEYDLEIIHPGNYAIELRYAALERRPLKLLVDGKVVNARAAVETSSSWNADGQIWSVAGIVKLTAGKHVVRLESRRAFPHVDKLAAVYQTTNDQPWPFGAPPLAMSRAGLSNGVTFPVIAMWRNHLNEIQRSTKADARELNFYGLWLALANSGPQFEAKAAEAYQQLEIDSPLRHQTPDVLRKALLDKRPSSVAALADVYASVVPSILHDQPDQSPDESAKKLREHLLSKSSPLVGPKADHERYYTATEAEQAERIQESLASIEQQRPKVPKAMGVAEAKPEDIKIHMRGSHMVLGKLVSRRIPTILARPDDPPIDHEASGRLQLAQWITRPDHPLTSRVMANRVWHWHFGRGIVPTTDNFGLLGLPPTHPELLDWLAAELVEHDWSLKHLHRRIVLSDVYQRSSRTLPGDQSDRERLKQCASADPENELLWKFRRRRLTAEETRDSILAIGGRLDLAMYGSLMKTESHAYVNTAAGGDLDYSQPRRSVYLPVIRSGVLDEMQTLDFPDPAMISGERQTSTVAPQALMMLNSDLVHEQTLLLADRLLAMNANSADRLTQAYRWILQREPTSVELRQAEEFIRRASQTGDEARDAWQSLCRVLVASNEFSYIE